MTTLDRATDYIKRGWAPIPLPPRSKAPVLKGWQKLHVTKGDVSKYFNGSPQNVGVLLGEPSGGLVDVDLDCFEAIQLADAFLPHTQSIFGRKGKLRSHRLYVCSPVPPSTRRYTLGGLNLLELRTTGGQTVFPGSEHPSGEAVEWSEDGDPCRTDEANLRMCLAKLATAVTLARHWPKQGSRQDCALALAGGLLRAGWTQDDVAHLIENVARAAGDEEYEKRIEAIAYTAQKLKEDAKVSGWPRLAKIIGAEVVDAVREWLCIGKAKDPTKPVVDIVQLSSVEPQDIHWLWPNRIPLGMLSIISGDPNTGKSMLVLDMAARVSVGRSWPDRRDEPNPVGDVILLAAEDGIADTIRVRVDNAEGEPNRIFVLRGVRHPEDDLFDPFTIERDLRHLEQVLVDRPGTRLVILDPLDCFLGGETDSHKKADVQRLLSGLANLAERQTVAVVGVLHLRKSTAERAMYRTMGSLGFVSAPRAAWSLSRDPKDKRRRLLTCIKLNIAADPDGMSFEIAHPGVIHWHTEPVTMSADEALAPPKQQNRTARDDAIDWLLEFLALGEQESTLIRDAAKAEGISWRTLNRAKAGLEVRAKKKADGSQVRWYWSLPQGCQADGLK